MAGQLNHSKRYTVQVTHTFQVTPLYPMVSTYAAVTLCCLPGRVHLAEILSNRHNLPSRSNTYVEHLW